MRASPDTDGTSSDATLAGSQGRPTVHADDTPLRTGDRLGRYVVLETVGTGAMGAVYAAYDPELNRRVALKLLVGGGRRAERLRAEAQAMARLSSPNVVTVHDVGIVDGRSFIAMEFVDGPTLEAWLKKAPRSPRAILRAFVAAGRGLAAAHRAGMVHRDFKPTNVMVETDESVRDGIARVLVTDFGLAQALVPTSSDRRDDEAAFADDGARVAGTPAYMAPEQFANGDVDARADQFSFCVALFEALHEQRPFAGKTITQLASAVLQGRRERAPRRRGIPVAVTRALDRGLCVDPDARFETMDALLAHIDPDRTRRRWWVTGGLVSAALGTGLWLGAADPPPDCEDPAHPWPDEARARAKEAFARNPSTYAVQWDALEAWVDTYVDRLATIRRTTCEAHEDGSVPDAALFARLECVDEAYAAVDALTELWADADVDIVRTAPSMLSSLPPPSACETRAVPSMASPIEDHGSEVIHRLVRARARALARMWAEDYDEALAVADEALDGVESLPDDATVADLLRIRAHAHVGRGELDAGADDLWASIATATRANDPRTAAVTWVWVMNFEASYRDRPREALRYRTLIDALAGADPFVQELAANEVGTIQWSLGDLDAAEAAFTEAVEHAETVYTLQPDHIAQPLNNLAIISASRDDFDAARAKLERALDLYEVSYGSEHPELIVTLSNLGRVSTQQGDRESAGAYIARALAIANRVADETPSYAVTAFNAAGDVAYEQGRIGDAALAYGRALAQRRRITPIDEAELAEAVVFVAWFEDIAGRSEDARAHVDEALALLEDAPASAAAVRAEALVLQAEVAIGTQDARLALQACERARAVLDTVDAPPSELRRRLRISKARAMAIDGDAIRALTELRRRREQAGDDADAAETAVEAGLAVDTGRIEQAQRLAQQALHEAEGPITQCRAHFAWARVVVASHEQPETIRSAIDDAQQRCRATSPPLQPETHRLDAMLADLD